MAAATLTGVPWPSGTVVTAWLASQVNPSGGSPTGSSTESAVVTSAATLSYTSLAYGAQYVAAAQISGSWRQVAFTADTPPAGVVVEWLADDGTIGAYIDDDGSFVVGPSLYRNSYSQSNVPDFSVERASRKTHARSLLVREVGDTAEIQLGRTPGTFPDAIGFTTLTAGITLPVTSVAVGSTTNFEASGEAIIESVSGSGVALVEYTGKTATSLTGVSVLQGSGSFIAGDLVTDALVGGTPLGIVYGSAWVGEGGLQDRSAQIGFKTTETNRPDGAGGYYSAGKILFSTTTPGPASVRRDVGSWRENGYLGLLGGWVEEESAVTSRLTVGGPGARVLADQALAGATIAVDSTAGFPTTGQGDDGNGRIFAYTGLSAQTFTGCSVVTGAGTIAAGSKIRLSAVSQIVAVAVAGQVAACAGQGVARTAAGNVGPAAAPEGGVKVGSGSGDVRWYRDVAGSKWVADAAVRLSFGGSGSSVVLEGSQAGNPADAEWQVTANGRYVWLSSGTPNVSLRRDASEVLGVRNGADSAYAGIRVASFGLGVTAAAQQASIAAPAGGATVDAEARTAVAAILTVLDTFGFTA